MTWTRFLSPEARDTIRSDQSLARDERRDAHEAPEHALELELERVMSSLVRHLTAAPSPLTPTEPPGQVRSSLADGRRR